MCSIKEVRILLGMLGGGENEKQQYLQCLVYLLILLEFFCALRQYKVMKKKKEDRVTIGRLLKEINMYLPVCLSMRELIY